MRKTEVAHHTPEQVHDYIVAAKAIVTKAKRSVAPLKDLAPRSKGR